MENIVIRIKGREASKQAAQLMKTVHKAIASMQNGRCHISVATSREEDYDEIIDIDLEKLKSPYTGQSKISHISMGR